MPYETLASAALPVVRVSLHDEIVARLRNMILEGELAPGSVIPELKLCEDLQISRTPLREALKVLAAEEFVTLLPNRGSIVREIVPEEIQEVFEVMEALEGLVARLAIARARKADIAELKAMHRRLAASRDRGEKRAYFDMNQAIHRRIAELTGNRVLAADYAGHANKIRRARYLANLSDARWAESINEHSEFMKALEEGDSERFAELLQQHTRRTAAAVVEALKAMPKPVVAVRRRRSS